jgi:putative nucleotidyltransferase with HDIG domain
MYWAKRLGRNQVRTASEAEQLSRDEALAATISMLERRDAPTADEVSLEEVVRANQLNTIQSLMWLLDVRDQSILTHSYAVSDLSGAIARDLGINEAEVFAVTTAALLHDLGKIALPDALLYKACPLSLAERALIQQHPALGAQILEVSPFLHHLMPAVQHHHENWDGTGYPDGLAGEAIPLAARIIRVAEAYEAMTTDRPYQRHRSDEEARAELVRCASTCFDPVVVQAALRVLARQEEAVIEAELPPFIGFQNTPRRAV